MRTKTKRMSKSKPTHRLAGLAERVVGELLATVEGAGAATIATADGFALAHAGSQTIDPSRLAAIVSSLAALSAAAAQETGLGRTRCLLVECDDGRLVVRCVEVGADSIVVAILTDQRTLLGRVWSSMAGVEAMLNGA